MARGLLAIMVIGWTLAGCGVAATPTIATLSAADYRTALVARRETILSGVVGMANACSQESMTACVQVTQTNEAAYQADARFIRETARPADCTIFQSGYLTLLGAADTLYAEMLTATGTRDQNMITRVLNARLPYVTTAAQMTSPQSDTSSCR